MEKENQQPVWLKAMQNGTIGEARTKALLLDRFWILERSVDIEGADFIIQRRITQTSILDQEPPRMGIVQVKFFSASSTNQSIHKDYVIDKKGNIRNEFFLICHTGTEEKSKAFFLTAEMINEDFKYDENAGKYKISGSKILNSTKYLVKNKKNTLDRIEQRLKLADYRSNRIFISSRLYDSTTDSQAILPDYQEPIRNSWGHIPTEFNRIKKAALKGMSQLEESYNQLKEITEEIDPIEAFLKIEEYEDELGSATYGHWGRELMENLLIEDFYYTCRDHKEIVGTLRDVGLLDNFINLRHNLKEHVSSFLSEKYPFADDDIYILSLSFKKSSFIIDSISHAIIKLSEYSHLKEDNSEGIREINSLSFEYYWKLNGEQLKEKNKDEIKEYYSEYNYRIYDSCLEKIYELEYPK